MTRIARALAIAGAIGLGLIPSAATAKPTAEAKRLIERRDAERYSVPVEGTSVHAGAARVHIAAPIAVVEKVLADFNGYPTHIKKVKQSRIVGKKGKQTDVYMQVEILNGLGKVWAVVRFDPMGPKAESKRTLMGRMLKGNVKRFEAKARLVKIDENNTQLNLELIMLPYIPLPGSLITGELKYAADEFVMGLRDWSEKAAKK